MMEQASSTLAYPQAWVEQEGFWLQWQQRAPSHAWQLSEPGWGPGGYKAPQAARRPLSASILCNPHLWPFGAWGSMWGARAGQWLKYHTLRALKKSNLSYSW